MVTDVALLDQCVDLLISLAQGLLDRAWTSSPLSSSSSVHTWGSEGASEDIDADENSDFAAKRNEDPRSSLLHNPQVSHA
jgi:hypothetical protein